MTGVKLNGIAEIYQAYANSGVSGEHARQLLKQQHWYASIAEFDPRTGDALPLALSEVLRRIAGKPQTKDIRDHLWRIVEHCRLSLEHIFASLSENPRREQAYLPVRDVKELNAASFIALSRRPGRNIREKLADKPYMQAVRRYQSVDLPQNRLVKEFATRLAELLELRKKHLGHEDDLLGDIYRWLRADESHEIGRWDNLPPNNTLLSHRDYRRVWDSWRRLQTLDDVIDRDLRLLEARAETIKQWESHARSYSKGRELFGEMPVLFDYDTFTIKPWRAPIIRPSGRARPPRARPPFESPACVDLTYPRPRFAASHDAAQISPEAYLWQRWKREGDVVDITLFDADIALLDPGTTTISIADLFFAKDIDESLVDKAAHIFTSKLGETFADPALIWLVPDLVNDFQVQALRHNINAAFKKAEPLPRSVAAVIDQVNYSRIKSAGFSVVVVDAAGGTTYATKLIAQHDDELQRRVPETRGFYWERSPSVPRKHDAAPYDPLVEIPRYDREEHWVDAKSTPNVTGVQEKMLRNNPQLGGFDIMITVSDRAVLGGRRLYDLQQRAADIPLWRDHIPELSIKVIVGGRYKPFYLVDRGTTIRPLRGVPIPIPVPSHFTLPSGRAHYEFPLFQGQDKDDLGYVARLESSAFPLSCDATCRLTMTYTYGADNPYQLSFEPLDRSFRPVQAKWQPKIEEIISDAPAPGYPTPLQWDDLRRWRDAQGNTIDLLAWLDESLGKLSSYIPNRSQLTISSEWRNKLDKHGESYWVALAKTEDGARYSCNTNQFIASIREDPNLMFPIGNTLYANLVPRNGGVDLLDISSEPIDMSQQSTQRIIRFKRQSLQNRISTIWSDSRSLQDSDCPNDFRSSIYQSIMFIEAHLPINLIREKMIPLYAIMHKDASKKCIAWIIEQIDSQNIKDPRAVGSSLGDLELTWQQHAFSRLTLNPTLSTIYVMAYAIWRTERFVQNFTIDILARLIPIIRSALGGVRPCVSQDKEVRRRWSRGVSEPLELLLGLLRTRASTDNDLRMLLQPHQEITKALASDLERIAEVVVNSSMSLSSRIQISDLPPQPEGDMTPPLLYALLLYLTGDVGANSIRVTGISDGEDD